jgi:low temperature requirement protein LtrA
VAGWLAFGRAGVCIWFMLSMIHTHAQHSERGFRFSGISLGTNFVSVLLMSAAAAASRFVPAVGIALLVTAAVVDVVHIPVLWTCAPFYRRSFVPIDANLAAERFGLIYLISLGELVLRWVRHMAHGVLRRFPIASSPLLTVHTQPFITHTARCRATSTPGSPINHGSGPRPS